MKYGLSTALGAGAVTGGVAAGMSLRHRQTR
jgi:hypothetical protein